MLLLAKRLHVEKELRSDALNGVDELSLMKYSYNLLTPLKNPPLRQHPIFKRHNF